MGAEVGGRGEGILAVGVAMDVFLGVEPECGLPPLGVAIVLVSHAPVTAEIFEYVDNVYIVCST